ncbi:MAG TPA: copper resistance CopC family protein [Gemmatimonadales bacterium]|nr:copper resistance CopC family protein [Gemmatimonadales bacterium]
MLHKLILVGATAGLLTTGAMHTHLTKAEPGIDSTVTVQPKELRLWFNEAPEVALSSATILTADNKPVGTVKMAATDDSLSVSGPITVKLEPGKYNVLWRTASADGHAVRGKYSFTYGTAADPAK